MKMWGEIHKVVLTWYPMISRLLEGGEGHLKLLEKPVSPVGLGMSVLQTVGPPRLCLCTSTSLVQFKEQLKVVRVDSYLV